MHKMLDWDSYVVYDEIDYFCNDIIVPIVGGGGIVVFSIQGGDELISIIVDATPEELRTELLETGFDIWSSLPGEDMKYEPTHLQQTFAIMLIIWTLNCKCKKAGH